MGSRGLLAIGAGLATVGAVGWMRVPVAREAKRYSRGVGLIQNGSLTLVSRGTARRD